MALMNGEGFDALLAFAAFDQPVKVLFAGDGVLSLTQSQNPVQQRHISKLLQSFDLYDIPVPFAMAADVKARNINHLCIPATLCEPSQAVALIQAAKHIYSF